MLHSLHVRSAPGAVGRRRAADGAAERAIAKAGFTKARLETNAFDAAAPAFYAARGYIEAERYPDQESASDLTTVLLVKALG